MRGDRPSLTASLVAAVRALYTELPPPYRVAPDPFAVDLLPRWLAWPARAAGKAPAAAPMVHRIVGVASLGMATNVALRTRAIDDALREAIAGGGAQLVLLGAGLDARAARLPELAGARVFEVDHPSTHRYKAERFRRIGDPAGARAVRVPIHFERDRLRDVLLDAGFDRDAPAFWIWEGVTVYLSRAALDATLADVAELSAPRSRLAVTYTRPGAHRRHPMIEPLVPLLGQIVGEAVRGMIETEALAGRLAALGFVRVSDESAEQWAPRYWPFETEGREWERLLVVEKMG